METGGGMSSEQSHPRVSSDVLAPQAAEGLPQLEGDFESTTHGEQARFPGLSSPLWPDAC